MKRGAELSLQAARRKTALNKEFDALLKALEGTGGPRQTGKQKIHLEEQRAARDKSAERELWETVESHRRTADLLRWEKAGLLDPAERQEVDREIHKLHPRGARGVKLETVMEDDSSETDGPERH